MPRRPGCSGENAVSSACLGGSLGAVSVTSEPGASGRTGRAVSADISAGVEYRLVRNRLVRDVERGRTMKIDVCDAHPELLRAARNVGRPTKEPCPICRRVPPGHGDLRLRGQAAGRGPLPGHGGRADPAVPAARAGALLRGRGVPGVRLAPPDEEVSSRRAQGARPPQGQRQVTVRPRVEPGDGALAAQPQAARRGGSHRHGDRLRRAGGPHRLQRRCRHPPGGRFGLQHRAGPRGHAARRHRRDGAPRGGGGHGPAPTA